MLLQCQFASINSPREATFHGLKESKRQLAAHGLAFVGPIVLPREGLVLLLVQVMALVRVLVLALVLALVLVRLRTLVNLHAHSHSYWCEHEYEY